MLPDYRVLVVEDNETMRSGMASTLQKSGCQVSAVSGGREALELYQTAPQDLVISDLRLGDMDGLEVLRQLKRQDQDALVLLVTAFGTIETAVEAMKLGAFDFITKPFSTDLLRLKLRKAMEFSQMMSENRRLLQENLYLRHDQEGGAFPEMVGRSQAIREIFSRIEKVAKIDSSVLITGESGTGKELVARAIHFHSPRRARPFVKLNCSALAEGVLESELFGHERGAFTGAAGRKLGRFEIAHQGTLFLDEIGDISPAIQLKLLRVLQEKAFERVGGTETIRVDVRIVAATNQDLAARVERGLFREDLFYRLHIIPINLPPLRSRKEDIPLLVEAFLARLRKRISKQVRGITPEALAELSRRDWPGNVRELENLLEQAYVFCEGEMITAGDLPTNLPQRFSDLGAVAGAGEPLDGVLARVERQLIEQAYRETGGIKSRTARKLGIKTSALYYKLEKYGIR